MTRALSFVRKNVAALSLAPLLLGACSSLATLDPMDAPVQKAPAIGTPAPDADRLMACLGARLARYVDRPADGVPPIIVEVTSFVNRNPSALQRLELPTDATTMIESLLASIGPSVGYREGWRADMGPRREEQRLAAVPSTIRVKGDIQIVEAALQQLEKGWDIALFNRNSDLSATKTAQASLAALTLEMTAVNQSGLGEYGLAAPVRLVFERSATRERSVAVSFSSAAVGFHDQVRTVYGYGHALRLGAAIQLVTVLSRATRVGANECLRAVAPEALDVLPLQSALRQFRDVMSKDARAAAFWLNKLRALHGREASRAFVIGSDSTTPEDEMTDIQEDSDLGSVARATVLDGLPFTAHEREFAYLWATLPDVPAEAFAAGSAWIDRVETQCGLKEGASAPGKANRPGRAKPAPRPPLCA